MVLGYLMLSKELLCDLGEKLSLLDCLLLLGRSLGNGEPNCLLWLNRGHKMPCCFLFFGLRATNRFIYTQHFRVFLWLFVALFPGFIVILSGGGAGKWVYSVLSRLESWILFLNISLIENVLLSFAFLRKFSQLSLL